MEEEWGGDTGVILDLTLQIIYLLTGENYTIVKTKSGEHMTPSSRPYVSAGWSRTLGPVTIPSPHPLMPGRNNKLKILDLTNKIMELLTRGTKNDFLKDVMMETHQRLTSLDGSSERSPSSLYSQDCPEEHVTVLQDHQDEDLIHIKVEVVKGEEETYLDNQQFKEEEIAEELNPGAQRSWDSPKELLIPSAACEVEDEDLAQGFSSLEPVTQHLSSEVLSETSSNEQCSHNQSDSLKGSTGSERRIYPCVECGKCFHNSANLSRHLRIHTGLKPFSCYECGKCFTRKSILDAHWRIHTGEKPFMCSECGRCFTQKCHLIKHQVIHTGEKPFLCSECGKCFMQKSDLLKHVKVHTGEKPFPCTQCGRRYANNLDLVNHERMHTGEKPFPCFECGKCFTQKSILVNHIKIHTGEKPFQCPDCGKRFAQKSKLLGHQRTHTGEKPYSCSHCGQCFGHKSSLVKHHHRVHTVTS